MDGLDRWGTHDAPPKTNFFPGPANGGNVSVRHLQCGRRAEKRSQRREERERERERRGTNYSSHELRLRARREMRVRGGGGYPLSSDREREREEERKTWERPGRMRGRRARRGGGGNFGIQKSRATARATSIPHPGPGRSAPPPRLLFSMHPRAVKPLANPVTTTSFRKQRGKRKKGRKEGRKEGRKKGNEGKKGKEEYLDVFGLPACLLHLCPLSDRSPSSALFSFPHFASVQHCPTALPSPPQGIVLFR